MVDAGIPAAIMDSAAAHSLALLQQAPMLRSNLAAPRSLAGGVGFGLDDIVGGGGAPTGGGGGGGGGGAGVLDDLIVGGTTGAGAPAAAPPVGRRARAAAPATNAPAAARRAGPGGEAPTHRASDDRDGWELWPSTRLSADAAGRATPREDGVAARDGGGDGRDADAERRFRV